MCGTHPQNIAVALALLLALTNSASGGIAILINPRTWYFMLIFKARAYTLHYCAWYATLCALQTIMRSNCWTITFVRKWWQLYTSSNNNTPNRFSIFVLFPRFRGTTTYSPSQIRSEADIKDSRICSCIRRRRCRRREKFKKLHFISSEYVNRHFELK